MTNTPTHEQFDFSVKNTMCLLMAFVFAIAFSLSGSVRGAPVAVANHSFESGLTSWSSIGSTGVWNGNEGLNPRPDATPNSAWSNGGELYQVLGTAVQPNTTYTLTVDVGDRSGGCCGFDRHVDFRVGSGAAFGSNLMGYTGETRTLPPSGGWQTWTAQVFSGPSPTAGSLRVELLNPGGAQPHFDNVRLDEVATSIPTNVARDVFVRNHSFEGDGPAGNYQSGVPVGWQISGGGGGGWMGTEAAELNVRPDGSATHSWSNGDDLFQVTGETITADTVYTVTADIGDRSNGCCGVPAGTEVRLGAGDTFGANLLTLDDVVSPTPNGDWETWSFTASIEEGNPLIGELLRIELFNPGGAQPQFDNIHISAFTAGESQVVPEPASLAIWSILGICLAGYGYRRRRNG